jgi:hypothetical protein
VNGVDPVGQHASPVLALASAVRDRLGQRDAFRARADRALRRVAADAGDRLLRVAARHHPPPGTAERAQARNRPRPQRQDLAGDVSRGDCARLRAAVDVLRALCRRRANVAHSGSAHRAGREGVNNGRAVARMRTQGGQSKACPPFHSNGHGASRA